MLIRNSKDLMSFSPPVPRKVLKEKYQGEPEPDEMFEDENEEESGDGIGGVLEQPSIYSPDHSKGWINPKTTPKPHPTARNHTSGNIIGYKYDINSLSPHS